MAQIKDDQQCIWCGKLLPESKFPVLCSCVSDEVEEEIDYEFDNEEEVEELDFEG